jgi:PhzF family phenazine biosynthesis protein
MPVPFKQVDVFTAVPFRGNPVAVVMDGSAADTDTMQRFANWTNLSETTFLVPPGDGRADYGVRIFTPAFELPFAGHPTIGTCHAWLEAGGVPKHPDRIVQECGIGLVDLKRTGEQLAFAAPPAVRSGPVEPDVLGRALEALGLDANEVVESAWVDNGPGWLGIRIETVERLRSITPTFADLCLGVIAPHGPDASADWEVRAFFPVDATLREDPVTGSLNASFAQLLLDRGLAHAPYVATQGWNLGRAGRVHVSRDHAGSVWVGGQSVTCIEGSVDLGLREPSIPS